MKPSLHSLLTLLHCSLCVTVTPTPITSNPRQHVLSYTPSSASATTTTATASATATSTSSAVPVDPYFTNGVQQVWRDDGTLLFQNTFGFKSRTYDVPISLDNRFRVGSNTKLYTAVCIYQLHEKGILNVTDSVSDYLDQSDFMLFGFPNQTTWCPQIHGGDGSCQSITFVQLMAMSSGMVDGVNCNYPLGSWELEYCQSYPTFQAYVGSIAKIVGNFINWPLSSSPGSGFHYTNENFMLLSYFVEKLSGLSFREYLQTNIFDVIGLENTYYDPWQSSLGPMDPHIGDEYRDYHDMATDTDVSTSYYGSSLCSDEFNTGAFCGTGGLVSTTSDMHTFYANLFIDYNPELLSTTSINALISPMTLTGSTSTYESYFGQGVGTDVYFGQDRPFVIYYSGGMYCASTSIRMLTANGTEPAIIATAFRNNVIVDAPSSEVQESLNSVNGTFYDIAYIDYEWDTYADSRAIVYQLASYFRAHDSASSSSNDDEEAVVIAIIVGGAVIALGLSFLFLFILKPWKHFDNSRSSGSRKSSFSGSLSSPILPELEDDVF